MSGTSLIRCVRASSIFKGRHRIEDKADTTLRARIERRTEAREQILAAVNGARPPDLREQAGLTHAQLATATGRTQARISQIKHGADVSVDTLRACITGLGGHVDVSPDSAPTRRERPSPR